MRTKIDEMAECEYFSCTDECGDYGGMFPWTDDDNPLSWVISDLDKLRAHGKFFSRDESLDEPIDDVVVRKLGLHGKWALRKLKGESLTPRNVMVAILRNAADNIQLQSGRYYSEWFTVNPECKCPKCGVEMDID